MHAVVARSACPSQNFKIHHAPKTDGLRPFWDVHMLCDVAGAGGVVDRIYFTTAIFSSRLHGVDRQK